MTYPKVVNNLKYIYFVKHAYAISFSSSMLHFDSEQSHVKTHSATPEQLFPVVTIAAFLGTIVIVPLKLLSDVYN